MTSSHCDRESEVIAAVRAAAVSASLNDHIDDCSACAETRSVAAAMLAHAANVAEHGHQPPMAQHVWRRAQAYRQAEARERATRAMRIMQGLGAVYIVAMLAWAMQALWHTQSAAMLAVLEPLTNRTVCLSAGGMIALVAIGGWVLVSLDKPAKDPRLST